MKLPIKRKYFLQIKKGAKDVYFYDAHITFVCEETGQTLKKDIEKVDLVYTNDVKGAKLFKKEGIIKDDILVRFKLKSLKD